MHRLIPKKDFYTIVGKMVVLKDVDISHLVKGVRGFWEIEHAETYEQKLARRKEGKDNRLFGLVVEESTNHFDILLSDGKIFHDIKKTAILYIAEPTEQNLTELKRNILSQLQTPNESVDVKQMKDLLRKCLERL